MAAEGPTWVVDASVAFGWFAAVPNSEQACLLLESSSNHHLIAPDLVLVELLNAAWKSFRLGAITAEQLDFMANRASEPFSRLVTSCALLARTRHWCTELNHPAYDCLYIALAEKENATLITADQRLLHKLRERAHGSPRSMDVTLLTTDSASAQP